MGIAKIYNQKQSGIDINGIIKDYYVYAGEKVSAGDFVEFINGVASKRTETSVDTPINNTDRRSAEVISAIELSENRVFIAHNKDTSNYYLCGVVCTIENAKIIVGTDTQLSTEQYTGYQISVVTLDENRVLIAHSYKYGKYYLYGMICTINGNSITVNTDTSLLSASSYPEAGKRLSATKLTDSKVFIAHIINGTHYFLYGLVASISGNSISVGADTSMRRDSLSYSGYTIATATLTSTSVFVAHSNDSNHYLYGVSVTISGSTISYVKSSDIALTSAVAYSGNFISVLTLNSSKVLVTHGSDSSSLYLHGIVCTTNGTTTTKGTDTQLSLEQYTGGRVSTPLLLDTGKVFIAHGGASSGGSSYSLYGMICSISGTTISVETDVRLNDGEYSGLTQAPILLGNDYIFITHSLTSANIYLYVQLFSVENNIPTNEITSTEYETQVRKATTSDIYGVAKTSGEGGDDTGHKDIVSIYTIDTRPTLAELPVGTLVKDTNSTFLGEPVIWKIADINHEGYPSNSVTLITERSIAMRPFDGKEPNNSNSARANYGNNRYSVSNIRQWLNSDAGAGMWYSAQHSADAPPSSSNVWQSSSVGINPYDTDEGFLNGFSQYFKNVLLETTLTIALNKAIDGGGSETVIDKIFLASNTEVGLANENSIVEGNLLSIFNDSTSRIAYCTTEAIEDSNYSSDPVNNTTAWNWWLRTPRADYSERTRYVGTTGLLGDGDVYDGSNAGVRPLCNLPSSIKVSQDEDGIYKLDF